MAYVLAVSADSVECVSKYSQFPEAERINWSSSAALSCVQRNDLIYHSNAAQILGSESTVLGKMVTLISIPVVILKDRTLVMQLIGHRPAVITNEGFTLLKLLVSQAKVSIEHLELKQGLFEAKKRELVNNLARQVAHDIRSPLGALEIALHGILNEGSERKDLAQSAIKRIKSIADDLISNTKPRFTNAIGDVDHTTNIGSAISEIVKEKQIIKPAFCHISMSKSNVEYLCPVPRDRFQRVISNLIDNAVEASPHGGEIIIELDTIEQDCVVRIVDTGNGIPQQVIDKLGIDPISYGKGDTKSGSGIGVSQAFRFLAEYGGTIKYSSIPGKGTTATIRIPLLKPGKSMVSREVIRGQQ